MKEIGALNILHVLRAGAHYQHHASTIERICELGHSVHVLVDAESTFQPKYSHPLPDIRHSGLTFGWLASRSDRWRRPLSGTREVLTYASYLNRNGQSVFYGDRWLRKHVPSRLRGLLGKFKAARMILSLRVTQSALRIFERIAPPDRDIKLWLESNRPDVVVASPMNMDNSKELEYVKAAKSLGIPTVVSVLSWDNLTTKGLFHLTPDLMLVWNDEHQTEAEVIHNVPSGKMVITGAPLFDKWTDAQRYAMDRGEFCRKVGLDPDQPYLAYLGSSSSIAQDESWLIREISDHLRRQDRDSATRNMGILVRPHPLNAVHVNNLSEQRVAVWPRDGAIPDDEEALRDYYNTLHHAVAVIGINTTGMVEAVINNKPCFTILSERYDKTQRDASHFQHLIRADALYVYENAEGFVGAIEKLMSGQDTNRASRERFVRNFVRPRGLNTKAGSVAAMAIEMVSFGHSASEINSAIDATEQHRDTNPDTRATATVGTTRLGSG